MQHETGRRKRSTGSQIVGFLGRLALFVGAGAVLWGVAGAETVSFPQYAIYSYSVALGLAIVIGGFISFIN
jgi:hypothetical protein